MVEIEILSSKDFVPRNPKKPYKMPERATNKLA